MVGFFVGFLVGSMITLVALQWYVEIKEERSKGGEDD